MKLARARLTRKLLVLLILPTLLCLAGFGTFTVRHRWDEMLAEADRELTDEVSLLKTMLGPATRSLAVGELTQVLETMAARQRVHGIAIYDSRCVVIARSQDLARAADATDRIACETLARRSERHGVEHLGGSRALLRADLSDPSGESGVIIVTHNLDEIEAMISRSTRQVIYVGVVLLVLMVGVASFIARSLARPLGGLVDAAERAASGDLSVRVEQTSYLDVQRVTDSFNKMMDALVQAHDRLEQAEESRREFERRIHHAQALSIVGQVAASVAHEVGSPLSTILGWARLGADDARLSEAQREQARVVAAQCERISRILRRLATIARPPESQARHVRLSEVVGEVVAFLEPECRRHGVRVRVEPDPEAQVFADRDELVQLILNLSLNALQAQPDGGLIVIAVRASAHGKATLEVRDTGPGVPRELADRIFEPFFSTRHAGGGTGLGLAIVSAIAQDLGGSVAVCDAPEGGACFRVELGPRVRVGLEGGRQSERLAVSAE